MAALLCTIATTERVFPPNYAISISTTQQLSLVDSSVANFSQCSAIWFFPMTAERQNGLDINRLRNAFRGALGQCPHFCGFLHLSPYEPERTGNKYRYGRVAVRYHDKKDPGAVFTVAHTTSTLADILPAVAHRRMQKIWPRSSSTIMPLVSPEALPNATTDLEDETLSPCQLQITRFVCGGVAVSLKLHHALGDAHTLLRFAQIMSNIVCGVPVLETRILHFQPEILDARAAGDIDAPQPDENPLSKVKTAPLLRHDWYALDNNTPLWVKGAPKAIADREDVKKPAGEAMPWSDWDMSAPVGHTVIHFTAEDVDKIHAMASDTAGSGFVSHHDSILAHVWTGIVLARERAYQGTIAALGSDDIMHANTSFSLRPKSRLDLGEHSAGSPIQMANITLPLSVFTTIPLPKIASTFRKTLTSLDRDTLEAQLHSLAYEASPQRIWQGFLGRKHLIITSWVKESAYDVDFGLGKPVWMESVMPDMDGIVCVCEGAPIDDVQSSGGARHDSRTKWWHDGVDVSIHLEQKALAALITDASFLMRM